jgi:hypothetical protein
MVRWRGLPRPSTRFAPCCRHITHNLRHWCHNPETSRQGTSDEGHAQVTLGNGTAKEVNLAGGMLRDRAGNRFTLAGSVPAQQSLTITIRACSMPLNHSGDDVSQLDPQGQVRHHMTYTAAQTASGTVVTFQHPSAERVDGDAWRSMISQAVHDEIPDTSTVSMGDNVDLTRWSSSWSS